MPGFKIDLPMPHGSAIRPASEIQASRALQIAPHRAEQLAIERKDFEGFEARFDLLVTVSPIAFAEREQSVISLERFGRAARGGGDGSAKTGFGLLGVAECRPGFALGQAS